MSVVFPGVDRNVSIPSMPGWERCGACAGGSTPGARAWMAHWLESYEGIAGNLGIYVCRNVGGSSQKSVHSCGRADDLRVPVTPEGHAVAYEYLRLLAPHAARLGICYLIFNRRQWSASRHPAGEYYGGVHPHDNHIHGELTSAAAAVLTLATFRAVVGDFRDDPRPTPPPPAQSWQKEIVSRMDIVNLSRVTGSRSTFVTGADVKRLQSLLAAANFAPANSFDSRGRPDGIGGPGTKDAVGKFQAAARTGKPSNPTQPDFVVGSGTWGALLGT